MVKFRNTFLTIIVIGTLLSSVFAEPKGEESTKYVDPTIYFENYYLQIPQLIPIDIRSNEEFLSVHIPGSLSDPFCLTKKVDFFFRYQPVVLIYAIKDEKSFKRCQRKYKNVFFIDGGIKAWADRGYPTTPGTERPILLKKGCSSLFDNAKGNSECL